MSGFGNGRDVMATRWGRCDYRQIERLQQRIERLQRADFDAFCKKTADELAARLMRKAAKRTPVDTGFLRNGWDLGAITKSGDTYNVEIVNDTEYASYVEYGHRTRGHAGWVTGRFMLTMSEMEIKAQAPAIIEKALKKFLKEELGW